mmetsp:Transcript_262/g.783  ORF Transcript_262/g.783 Transcript_262/m.783 type:complete len:209 (+) Transcript_262:112-738(+)
MISAIARRAAAAAAPLPGVAPSTPWRRTLAQKAAGGKKQAAKKKRPPKVESVTLGKEETDVLDLLKRCILGRNVAPKPQRTPEEVREMRAYMQEHSRRTLRETRARLKGWNDLVKLKLAATRALPGPLRREAETPAHKLAFTDLALPCDRLVPTDTPPIKGFKEKVAAAEKAIIEEDALAQREADAEAKRRARRVQSQTSAGDEAPEG